MKQFGLAVLCWILTLVSAWGGCCTADWDWGFLASSQESLQGERRVRALGPFLEYTEGQGGQRLWAVRPFYDRATLPSQKRTAQDFVWPIGMSRQHDYYFHWRFLLATGWDFDTRDPNSRYAFWILPIYYQGRDINLKDYLAVFPIAGTIREFLMQDVVHFYFFPLIINWQVNDVVTENWLWPIVSRTSGGLERRHRVFPFYGYSARAGDFEKKFILWPFYTSAHFYYPGSSGFSYIVFPLWGHLKLTDQESWMFLPPLFRFHRGKKLNMTYAPWPFIQIESGERQKFYIWPIWGHKSWGGRSTAFFLWPLFWKERNDWGPYVLSRFLAIPLYYSTDKAYGRGPNKGEVFSRYRKVWPLVSYQREGDVKRLRILALNPVQHVPAVERLWAPLWSLYTWNASPDGVDHELLWGLWRYSRRDDRACHVSLFPLFEWGAEQKQQEVREWSLLKGLIGYKREGDKKTFRLLYLLKF